MLRIRLRRVGKKKRPAYRVVVADSRAPRDGAFVEVIGLYDPLTEPATINIDEEKAKKWLELGAKPSETAAKLLARQGVIPSLPPVTRTGKAPAEPETTAPEKKKETPEPPAEAATAAAEPPAEAESAAAETPSEPESAAAETPSEPESAAAETPAEPGAAAAETPAEPETEEKPAEPE